MVKQNMFMNQSGQIGLIVMLVGAVLMTVAIGAVSQSIIETKTAKQEEVSSQAFNAAEQGVEQVLKSDLSVPSGSIDNLPVGYQGTYTVTEKHEYKSIVLQGHSADVNLVGASNLSVTWATPTGCGTGRSALIITLIDAGATVKRYAYSGAGSLCGDNFDIATPSCSGGSCTVAVPFTGITPVRARIKAVYGDASITASGDNMGVQGHEIMAQATNEQSGETRAVLSTRLNPAFSGIFDYVLFSGQGLSQ